MPKKKSPLQAGEAIPVRLVWDGMDNLETIYVNHAAIIHNGPEFYLVFGELASPLIKSEKEIPKTMHIVPKVRLAVSPAQIRAIADVLTKIAYSEPEKENDNS